MSEFLVIGYVTPDEAPGARKELLGLASEYLVDVGDAVVATADEESDVHLEQMVNLWAMGAAGGAFWGLIVGLIFINPMLGAALGAGTGALMGGLSDCGIDDRFMKDVAKVLRPGQAALFMMVRTEASDRVIERLGMKGGHIIRTNLDRHAEEHLRRTFNLAHSAERKSHAEGEPA